MSVRTAKPEWVRALRDLTGYEQDDIRYNDALGRWEFMLTSADGKLRSQFWTWFDQPEDPVTGLKPFRELDDDSMKVALHNLTKTFVGNPHDGAGSVRKEIVMRYRFNEAHRQRKYDEAGQLFADMTLDSGGRGRRLRGALATGYGGTVGQASRRIIKPNEAP